MCGAAATAAATHFHYFLFLAALGGHGELSVETEAHTIKMKGCKSGKTGSGLAESPAGGGASFFAEGAGKR